MEMATVDRDLLVIAKTLPANDFPIERPSVIALIVKRESCAAHPFPWKGADTDPPLLRWS